MRKLSKILVGLAGLTIAGAAAAHITLPGWAERGQNSTLPGNWPVSQKAQDLLAGLRVADLHSDALLWNRDLTQESDRGHVDLPRLRQGNVALQVFTIVTKSPSGQNYDKNSDTAFDNITPLVIAQGRPPASWFSLFARALDQSARLADTARSHPDQLMLITSRADLAQLLDRRKAGEKVVGGLLGIEGAHALEGQIETLDQLQAAGVLLVGLTHFFDNEAGGSLHGTSGAGLTDFGRKLVEQLIARHMVVDLAHASPAMAREVLAMPGARPIVSHTGIRSHCETPRNFDDALLQEVVAKGGIVGIGFWPDVTCGQTPAAVAESIKAAIALLGEENVALGSDYDGAVAVPFDAGDMGVLVQALLDAGLSEATIARVMGENQLAYLDRVLP